MIFEKNSSSFLYIVFVFVFIHLTLENESHSLKLTKIFANHGCIYTSLLKRRCTNFKTQDIVSEHKSQGQNGGRKLHILPLFCSKDLNKFLHAEKWTLKN